MNSEAVFARIRTLLGEEGLTFRTDVPQPDVIVTPERLLELCRALRDDPELHFESLQQVAGVDYPGEEGAHLRSTITLFSYAHGRLLTVHVDVPRDNPRVPSLCTIWPAAEWHERESWDLLGIVYTGHPDLRRIMLPDDWEGHPLRKDFEEKPDYQGIPTQREREWLSWQK
jgi:NADH-quinone oxidoreductase subunit C